MENSKGLDWYFDRERFFFGRLIVWSNIIIDIMCWWKWVIGGAILAFIGLLIFFISIPSNGLGQVIGGICFIVGGFSIITGIDRARILFQRWHNR